MASDEMDEDKKQGVFSKILEPLYTVPCTRGAYLHAFGSGLLTGVTTFLFTSNVRRASNFGVLTFALVMPGSFFYCRWKKFNKRLEKDRSSPPSVVPWRPDEDVTSELKET